MYELMVRRTFAAAHQLRGYKGKCESLHGHNWVVEAFVEARELDHIGLAIDFGVLKRMLSGILEELDHKHLNERAPFDTLNPSSENLARFIHDVLKDSLAGRAVQVCRVRVWESPDACATYMESRA